MFSLPADPVVAKVEQSSDHKSGARFGNHVGTADLAIDGDKNMNYRDQHCAHTKQEPNPWWKITWEEKTFVKAVSITNRDTLRKTDKQIFLISICIYNL